MVNNGSSERSEAYRQAQRLYDEMGEEAGNYITRSYGDVRRSGDPEIIDYWKAVMNAFDSVRQQR